MNTKIQAENQEEKTREIEEMYRVGFHFGRPRQFTHPKMRSYIYTIKEGVSIFDLEQSYGFLKKAEDYLSFLGKNKSKFLLVGTKPEAKGAVEEAGRELSMPYVVERWLGGTLTNFNAIKGRVDVLKSLREKRAKGEFSSYPKKEAIKLDKRLVKMEKQLGGLESLFDKPVVLILIDSKEEKVAVMEAKKTNTPVVALLNSDCDISAVNYPIPGNDSSVPSIKYLLDKLIAAYKSVEV